MGFFILEEYIFVLSQSGILSTSTWGILHNDSVSDNCKLIASKNRFLALDVHFIDNPQKGVS